MLGIFILGVIIILIYQIKGALYHNKMVELGIRQIEKNRNKIDEDRWIPASKQYNCPQCGMNCSKEEYEAGECEQCDVDIISEDFAGMM